MTVACSACGSPAFSMFEPIGVPALDAEARRPNPPARQEPFEGPWSWLKGLVVVIAFELFWYLLTGNL